jgi:hypothetical protein
MEDDRGRDHDRTDDEDDARRDAAARCDATAVMPRRGDGDTSRHTWHEGVAWRGGDTQQSTQQRPRRPVIADHFTRGR